MTMSTQARRTNATKRWQRILLLTWRKTVVASGSPGRFQDPKGNLGTVLQFITPETMSAMGAIPFEPTPYAPYTCSLPRG